MFETIPFKQKMLGMELFYNEGWYWPNSQTNLFMSSMNCSHYFAILTYLLGQFEHSSPNTKELHGLGKQYKTIVVVQLVKALLWTPDISGLNVIQTSTLSIVIHVLVC